MIRFALLAGLLVILFNGCSDSGSGPAFQLAELPDVRVTQVNYLQTDIERRVPDSALLSRFSTAYGSKYSEELKAALTDFITRRATELGLSTAECRDCLLRTGQLDKGVIALPYLAERAMYNSTEAWIFEFTWGLSTGLGHYRCFVMGAAKHDTLLYITCR